MSVEHLPVRCIPTNLSLWHENGGFTIWTYFVRNHPQEMIAHPRYFASQAKQLSPDDFIFVQAHWDNQIATRTYSVESVEPGKVVLVPNVSAFNHESEPIYQIEQSANGKFKIINRSGQVVRDKITKTLAEQLISKNISLEETAA